MSIIHNKSITMNIDKTKTQIASDFNAVISRISDGRKAYTRPVLTRYGKVSKLTAAVTGSNTDTFGGNQFG
jgi:hypothetical protein